MHLACSNSINAAINKDNIKRGIEIYKCIKCNKDKNSDTYSDNGGTNKPTKSNDKQSKSAALSVPTSTNADLSPTVIEAFQVAVEKGQANALNSFQNQMTKMFSEFSLKQKEFNQELSNTVATLRDDIGYNKNKIDSLEIIVDAQKKEIEVAKSDKVALENKITVLERNLNFQEQVQLQTSLEIHGLPLQRDESLTNIFCDIAAALNVAVNTYDISSIYRIGKGDGNSLYPTIVMVKLFKQNLRNEIIDKRKHKTNFSTKDCRMNKVEKRLIFIREPFSLHNCRIYAAALNLKKSNKIKYLWISRGKIFCRREDGALRLQLFSLEDLDKFK